MTAASGDGDVRGSIQAERELQAGAPGHRGAVLRLPALARCQVDLEDAVVGRRRRYPPPADPGPGQRGPGHRAVQRASRSWTWPGWTPPRRPRSCSGRWTGPPQPPGQDGHQAEEPRFPGTIPPIWNVPARNADFTGRGATLELLRDKLAGGGRAVVVAQALYGLGGVGKTQLALEYAHRFMADYDLVWWVPSERAEEISGGARRPGPQDGPAGRRQRGRGGRGGAGGAAPRHHPALAADLRQRRRPQAARAVPAHRVGARPHHLAEPGLDALGRAARGGRLHPGRERRAPAAARARAGPGRRANGSPTRWAICRWRSSRPARGWSRPGCRPGSTSSSWRPSPPGSWP